MDNLTQELLNNVGQHLPQMVGTELKNRLVKADKDAEELDKLKLERKELLSKVDSYNGMKALFDSVTAREAACVKREHELALKELECKVRLEFMNGDRNFIGAVVKQIFQDRTSVYGFNGNLNWYPGGNGNVGATLTKTE